MWRVCEGRGFAILGAWLSIGGGALLYLYWPLGTNGVESMRYWGRGLGRWGRVYGQWAWPNEAPPLQVLAARG